MRFRSKKREREYRERRKLVEQILTERQICERCTAARSVDVHEIIRRSQWRAGILVPSNLLALCRECHTFITVNPAQAIKEGFSDYSYNRSKYEDNRYLNHDEERPE